MVTLNSENKNNQNAGQTDHERLSSLINSMTDGVIAIDENLKIATYNAAALNVLDRNNLLIGSYLYSVLPLVNEKGESVDVENLINNAKTPFTSRDLKLVYPDGNTANLYISITPVRPSYGKQGMQGHVVLLRDITSEKSLEDERDEFISVVSHELRTPIAISEGNISNAQLIAEKTGDIEKIKEALRLAHDQILYLSDMFNDLSTLSRAERGKLRVDIEKINIHELVSDLIENYKTETDEKGIELKTFIDPGLSLLSSSKLYVGEILQNFITNAIKYTEKGHVFISAKPAENGVIFTVEDSGIGISKSDQEKVFNKFFRSENFETKQSKGTGLGLYVALKLSKLIKAKISLNSELGKGSSFMIFVPNLVKPKTDKFDRARTVV